MYEGWSGVQLVRHSNVSRAPVNRRRLSEVLIFSRAPDSLTRAKDGKLPLLRRMDERDWFELPLAFLAG